MTTSAGRFTEVAMKALMRRIAAEIGAAADDARLVRLTNNAVFALPTAGVVIRITRSHGLHDRVHKVVRLATYFESVDAPTIRLAPGVDQPLQADDLLATVWRYVPPTRPEPTVADLGRVLRRFHGLNAPTFAVPTWDPVGDARARLGDAEALRDSDRDLLLEWCDRLTPRVAELNARAERRLVHGDAHVGNLLRLPDGQPVMCDFDATCVGPWQVDLVAVAIGEARFGRAGAHRALADAYGYDITTDSDWPLLREARELKMVAAAVPLLASAPGVANEFAVRLGSIVRGDPSAKWTPFADLSR
jgi:aminoglycoside phosphotransferase (APT) family kinase protein